MNRLLKLSNRYQFIIAVSLSLVLLLSACSSTGEDASTTTDNASESIADISTTADLKLTLDELASYDGTDGQPAYVAIDGVIYDVTDNDSWTGGKHNGAVAGNDLTDEIDQISPHGRDVLDMLDVVGELVD